MKLFTGPELDETLPPTFGRHDIVWIQRDDDGLIVPETAAGETLNVFLRGVNAMIAELRESDDSQLVTAVGIEAEELDEYTYGTAFYNYVQAKVLRGNEFHYDSSLDRPIVASNAGAAVLRFVGFWDTGDIDVSYVFSSNPQHHDRLVGEVMEEGSPGLTIPKNDHVILFNEGSGLHGVAPADERPGESTVIYSVTLCKERQVPKTKFQYFEFPPRGVVSEPMQQ